jgi:hypothetical protein
VRAKPRSAQARNAAPGVTIAAIHAPAAGLQSEPTEAGEQTLVPGVRPISLRERLSMRAEAPLQPTKLQRAMDIGLFDLAARNQLDLL